MNKNKPQGNTTNQKYKRYLNKFDSSDIWARELLNGLFEIDDYGQPLIIQHETFLSKYILFEEINNG